MLSCLAAWTSACQDNIYKSTNSTDRSTCRPLRLSLPPSLPSIHPCLLFAAPSLPLPSGHLHIPSFPARVPIVPIHTATADPPVLTCLTAKFWQTLIGGVSQMANASEAKRTTRTTKRRGMSAKIPTSFLPTRRRSLTSSEWRFQMAERALASSLSAPRPQSTHHHWAVRFLDTHHR
jgi:hypothetical protein